MTSPKRQKRKYRRRSPWGNLFGKPIEDLGGKYIGALGPNLTPKDIDIGRLLSQDAFEQQYKKMLQLKKHYGIKAEKDWYALALAIASEFDPGFRIVNATPAKNGQTARKWRGGVDGLVLVHEVDAARRGAKKGLKLLAVIEQIREADPKRYGKYKLNHLEKNYYEAMRSIKATKQNKSSRSVRSSV